MKYLKIVVIVFFVFSATVGQATAVTKATLKRRVHKQINEYRVEQGLDKLAWNKHIAKIARQHSEDMAQGVIAFGHDGFSDRVAQIESYIPGLLSVSENVAYTNVTTRIAKSIVAQWVASTQHRKNIEGKQYNTTGIGVAKYNGYYFFTEILEEDK